MRLLALVALVLAALVGMVGLSRAQAENLIYLPLVIKASSSDFVPTPAPTVIPSVTAPPSLTVTTSPTAAFTLTPTATRPTATTTATATDTVTATRTATATNTPTPTVTLTPTWTPTATNTATRTTTTTPTATPAGANVACNTVGQVQICGWMSDATPFQYTVITDFGRLTVDGVGVGNLQMTATWHFASVTVQCSGVTGTDGIAACSRNIGAATPGRIVTVDVTITYQGSQYTATTSFVPVAATPTPAPPPTPTATVTRGSLVITTVSPTGTDEYIEVRNNGNTAQSMAGWTLQSWDGTTTPCSPEPEQIYSFPSDFTLDAGASVRLHSGSTGGNRPRTPTDLPWTTRNYWNDNGDRGDLRNPSGQLVSFYAYGRCD